MELLYYKKCSTCKRAYVYLIERGYTFDERDIKDNNPTKNELETWINKYNIDIYKLFNKSGILYKKMNLKDKILSMKKEELLDLLSSDGMLIKRPLLILEDKILIGYKKEVWNDAL